MPLRLNSHLVITDTIPYHLNSPSLNGEIPLENEHVLVQKFVVPPHSWEVESPIGWIDTILLSEGQESGNSSEEEIDLIWVTLKGGEPINPDIDTNPLHYPLIPIDTLINNDRVIVQRVQVEPGRWEGIHSHPGNQIHIHVTGGTWGGRLAGVELEETKTRAAGNVGWMDAIDISEQHESGNVGDTTIDLIWVTLK